MKKKFFEFLKQEGAYYPFINNWERSIMCGSKAFRWNIPDPFFYIVSSFSWLKAPEKGEYWLNLHEKWTDIVIKEGAV